MMAKLSLTGIAAFALCLAAGAAAAQDPDWPCEQVLQPQLSVGCHVGRARPHGGAGRAGRMTRR